MGVSPYTPKDTFVASSNDVAVCREPEYLIANTQEDREAAFELLYQSYVRAELSDPNEHEVRVTPFHLLPESPVFVSKSGDEVISTVTMVIDGVLGLPIDTLYSEKIEQLRRFGAKCAEMCCLADRRLNPERGLTSLIEMTRMALYYAMQEEVDCLLLIAHPRHGKFYKRAMGFKAIDEVRSCPYVKNRPAEPLILNLAELRYHKPRLYDRYFGEPVPPERLIHEPMESDELEYFAQFLSDDALSKLKMTMQAGWLFRASTLNRSLIG